MLRRRIATCLFTLAAGSLAIAAVRPALFQEPQAPQPTEQHEFLLQGVGSWEGTIQMFMPGMEGEPTPATETIEAIGSFWTRSKFESTFAGMPFVGSGCTGYDPAKKAFVATWVDNTTTSLTLMEGKLDPKTNTLTMRWQAPDMATGAMTAHRSELVVKKDTYTMTFYMGEGEGMKAMVIDMKRKGTATREAGAGR
jgi:hypothetical protein